MVPWEGESVPVVELLLTKLKTRRVVLFEAEKRNRPWLDEPNWV